MRKKPIILIGGGGHCKSCIEVIESENIYSILGILDIEVKVGENILGYPIIGTDEKISTFVKEGYNFLITIGQINNSETRATIYRKLKRINANLPVIISPNAIVSKHSGIYEGTIIMHQAIINAGVFVGKNCIINTRVLIEHDSLINANTHVSTNAIVNGNCEIGQKCFIGSGAIINQGIKIADEVIIGSGSVVTKSIEKSGVYVGSPAKRIK